MNRYHLREYLIEAAGLGAFMVSACLFAALLEHPASPLRALAGAALDSAAVRRAWMGLAMGATAVAIIYSPWGKLSGAHINPAVTLTYWRLGRIRGRDAAAYALFQTLGGVAGVVLSSLVLGASIAHPAVNYVVTVPGSHGALAALGAESAISFVLMLSVLACSGSPRTEPLTGFVAGTLVALYIALEAPLSGMSINPARTIASALPSGVWTGAWIYFVAPPLAMLAAASLYERVRVRPDTGCAKLRHDPTVPCIFCE